MVKSMTGYGRAVETVNGREFTVELRSVNNRYLDCNVKLPRSLTFAEEAVKQAVSVPVIGNGDVTTPQRAAECFDRYGVDAVMIGRASFGQPWIFRDVKHYLEHGEPAVPFTFKECMDILREQVKDSVEWLGERPGILHVRRHLAATPLLKGLTDFRPLRIEMLRCEKMDELMAILDRIVDVYG